MGLYTWLHVFFIMVALLSPTWMHGWCISFLQYYHLKKIPIVQERRGNKTGSQVHILYIRIACLHAHVM